MRAARLNTRPSFALMKQTDVQSVYHMQMPRWLFSDPRYAEMNLDAKVTYTFLLNRFQLSRRNGWVNEYGEVFVIFPRKALASELRICEQRVTAAFKKLVELKLVWEKRCGRGDANQIYLAQVTPIEDPEYECAPFLKEHSRGSRTAGIAVSEPQNRQLWNGEKGGSGEAEPAAPEAQHPRPNHIDKRENEKENIDVSQSIPDPDGEQELAEILNLCELHLFEPEAAMAFEDAIERLFYSDSFRIGRVVLPRSRIRVRLHRLNELVLRDVESKLRANLERNVRNSTAYTMTTILNSIGESDSALLLDPYLNSLRAPPDRR